jgi:hypothetical protein
MIRLRRDDFEDPHELAKFAATAGMSLERFRGEFQPLIDREPPPLQIAVPDHLPPPVEHRAAPTVSGSPTDTVGDEHVGRRS